MRQNVLISLERPGRGVEGYGLVNALVERRNRSYISDRRLRFGGIEPEKLVEERVEKGRGLGGGVGRGRGIRKASRRISTVVEEERIRGVYESMQVGREGDVPE